jgi:hypothetical protein
MGRDNEKARMHGAMMVHCLRPLPLNTSFQPSLFIHQSGIFKNKDFAIQSVSRRSFYQEILLVVHCALLRYCVIGARLDYLVLYALLRYCVVA